MPDTPSIGTKTKILIAGGGVAGLAIGWRLAGAGGAVEIFERGLAGRQGTWAAAGMLAAAAETGVADDAHARLARLGRAQWPDFARELEEASGCSISYRQTGSLLVALDANRAGALSAMARNIRDKGERAEFLSAAQARAREPALTADLAGALHAPDDAQVDNRALGGALATAFLRAGGVLHETAPVRALHIANGRVRGVTTDTGPHAADIVIVAAGAWSSLIETGVPGALPPVRAAKGQMIAMRGPNVAAMPRHLLWGPDIYIVPRRDTVLLGATVEDCGFDTSVSRETCERFVAQAVRLAPGLAAWSIAESWAGLRPLAPDENPVLGETGISGLFIASGQFRNGILFAPVIADILCRLVSGAAVDPLVRAFDPRRFSGA